MQMTFKRLALALVGASLLTLYGCGGGGGDAAPGASAPLTISGTAAAGLPLVGSVTVKDANGVVRSTTIGANGDYSVDVTGMTAPYVFRATGTVGGRSYVLHSAASAADANGTINITPLTDLIVANIAGQLAANYFEAGSFGGMTRAELDAETASLKAKLLPVLQAMGVDSSIDLLRTAFTPLASALDKALDVISISVDPATNAATITNLVTQQQIVDSLATKAAAETAAPALSGAGTAAAADDIPLIRKAVTDFSDKFATGLPSPSALLPLMHDTSDAPFRDSDLNASDFSNQIATYTPLVGARFTDIAINRIDYTTVSALGGGASVYPRAYVSFNIRNSSGGIIDQFKSIQIAKGTDGKWRLRGDNRRLSIYGQAHTVKNDALGCVSTGLEFGIEDLKSGNNGTGISYVTVKGPGLPADGLKYVSPGHLGEQWRIQGGNQDGAIYYVLATNCEGFPNAGLSNAAIAQIPNGAKYVVTPYDADDVRTMLGDNTLADADRIFSYTESIPGRPLTLAEAVATTFPSATITPSLASYSGGSLTIAATGMQPNGGWVYLGLTDGGGLVDSTDSDLTANASGNATATLELTPQQTVTRREVRVETRDALMRAIMTVFNFFTEPS